MCPGDLPPDRSLFDCQDAHGDPGARARSPAELLDNLRLRLRQLPDGHPSAVRDRDAARDAQPAPEPPAERIKEPTQADDYGEPDDPMAGGPVADSEAGDTPADDGADAPAPGEGSLADLIRSIKDGGDALSAPADAGLLGEVDLFAGSGNGDPYRPWFMSGEPGTPWFAAGEEP